MVSYLNFYAFGKLQNAVIRFAFGEFQKYVTLLVSYVNLSRFSWATFFIGDFVSKITQGLRKYPTSLLNTQLYISLTNVSSKRRPRPDYFRVFLAIYHSLLHLIKLVLQAGFINMSYNYGAFIVSRFSWITALWSVKFKYLCY